MMNIDLNQPFEEIVKEVTTEYKGKSTKEKNEVINYVCEHYVSVKGRKPDSYQLTLLGNLLLEEIFSNPDPHKLSKTEYPVLSHSQQKRRKQREFTVISETMDFMNFKKKQHLSTGQEKDIL